MVRTDLDLMFRQLLWNEKLTRKNICDVFEITPSSLSRLLRKEMPTPQLVNILEVIGYDIEINCVKRNVKEVDFSCLNKTNDSSNS